MEDGTSTSGPLERCLSGDVQSLQELAGQSRRQLLAAGRDVDLIVSRDSVARVLRAMGRRGVCGADAQAWASFVRRGYIAPERSHAPTRPLMIEYEVAYEGPIVEVIARLDEIGDGVDGEVPTSDEIRVLLAGLGLDE